MNIADIIKLSADAPDHRDNSLPDNMRTYSSTYLYAWMTSARARRGCIIDVANAQLRLHNDGKLGVMTRKSTLTTGFDGRTVGSDVR